MNGRAFTLSPFLFAHVSPSSASDDRSRLASVVRSIATLAQRLIKAVAVLAATSGGAGVLLWGLLWWPLGDGLLLLFGAATSLVVLLAPGVILGLFYQGLRELRALPDRMAERTDRTLSESAEAARSVRAEAADTWSGRLWGILKRVWALRAVLLENRALLVRYGALLRFVTPGFVLLVVGATAVSFLLIPVSLGAGLVVLLW